jgi:hypothetical protein
MVHSSVEFKGMTVGQLVDGAPNSLTETSAQLYKSEQHRPLRVTKMRHQVVSMCIVASVLVTGNSERGSWFDRPKDLEIWTGYQPGPYGCLVSA